MTEGCGHFGQLATSPLIVADPLPEDPQTRIDAGAEVSTKPVQTQPMPASNQRTPIHARRTESHIVDAPTMSGARVATSGDSRY